MNTKDLIERLENLSETLDYEVDSHSHDLRAIEDAISVIISKDAEIKGLREVLKPFAFSDSAPPNELWDKIHNEKIPHRFGLKTFINATEAFNADIIS